MECLSSLVALAHFGSRANGRAHESARARGNRRHDDRSVCDKLFVFRRRRRSKKRVVFCATSKALSCRQFALNGCMNDISSQRRQQRQQRRHHSLDFELVARVSVSVFVTRRHFYFFIIISRWRFGRQMSSKFLYGNTATGNAAANVCLELKCVAKCWYSATNESCAR